MTNITAKSKGKRKRGKKKRERRSSPSLEGPGAGAPTFARTAGKTIAKMRAARATTPKEPFETAIVNFLKANNFFFLNNEIEINLFLSLRLSPQWIRRAAQRERERWNGRITRKREEEEGEGGGGGGGGGGDGGGWICGTRGGALLDSYF